MDPQTTPDEPQPPEAAPDAAPPEPSAEAPAAEAPAEDAPASEVAEAPPEEAPPEEAPPEEAVPSAKEILALAAVEIEEEDLPEDFKREFEAKDESSLVDRLVLLLSEPRTLLRSLVPASGWFKPLVVVLIASLIHATVVMNLTDLEGHFERKLQEQYDQMPSHQRRMIERMDESQKSMQRNLQLFFVKMAFFVGPIFKAFIELGVFATLLFAISIGTGGSRSYRLCSSIVGHALLIDAVSSLAQAVTAAATGLVATHTSLAALVPESYTVARGALSWVNPFTLAFALFLGFGLVDALKVKKRAAALIVLALAFLLGFGCHMGLLVLAQKMSTLGKG